MKESKLFGVIGHPISHSKSPLLHNYGLRAANIDGHYYPWHIFPENIGKFVSAVKTIGIEGVSITIPHKETVIEFLDGITEEARLIGAVNTLFWKDGKLLGDNTDWYGFLEPVKKKKVPTKALLLGGGGAAKAVIYALQSIGVNEIYVAMRDHAKGKQLFELFQNVKLTTFDEINNTSLRNNSTESIWIINCTPIGMLDKSNNDNIYQTPMTEWALKRESQIGGEVLLYDLVYTPEKTKFLSIGESLDFEIQTAVDMFIYQAVRQFEIWNDFTMSYDALRNLLKY